VREEFFTIPPRQHGETLTVLITGGSQGSRTLNRAAEESWPLWENPIRLIHQTGAAAYEELAPRFRAARMLGEIKPFIEDMAGAFAAADLVVGRAGMGTVSELAAAGRPSILVPLPTASDQHQLRNAEALERAGAARLIPDVEFTGARLVEEVTRLSSDPATLEKMGQAARSFAKPGAAQRAADVLESFIKTIIKTTD